MDYNTFTTLANSIQQREAPGAAEGVYHKSQEQKSAMTTRFGVDMTTFPKVAGETDMAHFQRVYKDFAPAHQAIIKQLPKANAHDLLKVVWNTGANSSISRSLMNANIKTPVGKNKLFAEMNKYVSVNNGKNWSSGLVTARAKDWNVIAKAYDPTMVIDRVKYIKGADNTTYRQYVNSAGKVLRTMYSPRPLASNNKEVAGTTVKIGGL